MKKLYNAFTTLLVVLAAALALLLAGPRLVGYRLFTVLSGSMEPAYPVGSLLYVKEVEASELEAGDVITFLVNETTVVTHRIIEVVPDEEDPSVLRFRTQGDANNSPDAGLVHYRNVLGTPVLCIPKLGRVLSFIQQPPGLYFAIAAGALLILLVFLPDLREEKEPEKEPEEKPEKEKLSDRS